MNIDIATILESHRKYILEHTADLYDKHEDEEAGHALSAMANAHDRATTRTLLDLHRTSNSTQQVGNAVAPTPITTVASRKVKAGSKKARDRAIKAGETRRRNIAAKQGTQTDTPPVTAINGGTASEGGAA